MKTVKWTGHPSPLEDRNIVRLLGEGRIPFALAQAFRKFEHNHRISAVHMRSTFSIGPDHGMSRYYVFGPAEEQFVQEMEDEDFERLTRHPLDRYMFLDITDTPLRERVMRKDDWNILIDAAMRFTPPAVRVS